MESGWNRIEGTPTDMVGVVFSHNTVLPFFLSTNVLMVAVNHCGIDDTDMTLVKGKLSQSFAVKIKSSMHSVTFEPFCGHFNHPNSAFWELFGSLRANRGYGSNLDFDRIWPQIWTSTTLCYGLCLPNCNDTPLRIISLCLSLRLQPLKDEQYHFLPQKNIRLQPWQTMHKLKVLFKLLCLLQKSLIGHLDEQNSLEEPYTSGRKVLYPYEAIFLVNQSLGLHLPWS